MFIELQVAADQILAATGPADVFGDLAGLSRERQLETVQRIHRELSQKVNPAIYGEDLDAVDLATEAGKRLAELYRQAQERIRSGSGSLANSQDPYRITGRKGVYQIQNPLAEGDLCTLYRATITELTAIPRSVPVPDAAAGRPADSAASPKVNPATGADFPGKAVVLKVVNDPADNAFISKEIEVLSRWGARPAPQHKHLPRLIDDFATADHRRGCVIDYLDGLDLYAVREHPHYHLGVPPKHMVWMLNRLLSVLGYAHQEKVVHGNIEPAHLMIRPRDHNLWLLDWGYAAVDPFASGDRFKVYNAPFSAPEVQARQTPVPASDLYAAGKCMMYILGGDPAANRIPDAVPDPLRRLLEYMVLESPLQRARDAWQLHRTLIGVVEDLWGPREFIAFKI